jgi:hypothetical protein
MASSPTHPTAPSPDRWPIAAGWGLSLLLVALTISHRPDAVLNPQFWAEDGQLFYSEAYNHSWAATLVQPYNGFFHTLPRLVAALSLLAPVRYGPAIFNAVAILIEVAPALFLLTDRLASVIPDRRVRLLLALVYVGIPNSWDIHANIANSVFHLPLLALMVFLAGPPTRLAWRVHDLVVVGLTAVSGPFVLALLPVAALRAWLGRHRWQLGLLALLAAGGLIQAGALLANPGARSSASLGASPLGLVDIISGQVLVAGLCGTRCYQRLHASQAWTAGVLPVAILLAMAAPVGLGFLRGNQAVRLLCLFAVAILAAALIKPQATLTGPQWAALAMPGVGARYYQIPILATIACLTTLALRPGPPLARLPAGAALLVLVFVGLPVDWIHPPFRDLGWNARVSAFEASPRGSVTEFPLNPTGWRMELVRR